MKYFIAIWILFITSLSLQVGQARVINEVKKKPVIVRFTDEEGNTEKILIERQPQIIAPRVLRAPSSDLMDDDFVSPNEIVNPVRPTIYKEAF